VSVPPPLLFRDEHRERAVGDVEVDPGAVDVRWQRPAALPLAARAAAAHGQPPPRIVEHNGQGRGVARLAVFIIIIISIIVIVIVNIIIIMVILCSSVIVERLWKRNTFSLWS
jgi:hypothetical protein